MALTILCAFCEWLTRQRYLDSNPWDGVPPRRTTNTVIGAGRILTRDQWRALLTHADTLPRGLATARLQFILRFAYMTGARRLAAASPHWLRHSYATHALESNVPIEVVQSNLGHASLSTTTIYITAEDQRRYREIERFSQEDL